MLGQLVLRDDAIAMVHQIRQDAKFVAGEFDVCAVARHARQPGIELDGAGTQRRRYAASRAPDERAQARQDFLHPKRLGHVIIGAAIDALHLFVPATPRGQYEDRHGNAGLPPLAQQREPIHARQAEVEHDGIIAFGLHEKVGALAVACSVNRVAGLAKRSKELPGQRRFILHHDTRTSRLYRTGA